MPDIKVPGWKQSDAYAKINEIADIIFKAAFRIENGKPDLQRIIKHNPRANHPEYIHLKKIDPNIESKIIKEMIYKIAEAVFDHKKGMDTEKALEEAKGELERDLDKIRKYLESYAGRYDAAGTQQNRLFNISDVNKAMKALTKGAHKLLMNSIKDPNTVPYGVKGMYMLNPNSPEWVDTENKLISIIGRLYKDYLPKQTIKDHISYFTTIVFISCGLWPDKPAEKAHTVMSKRFKAVFPKN